VRRLFPVVVFACCALVLGLYFLVAYSLDAASRRALGSVVANSERLGFRMQAARFTAVRLDSPDAVHWENFSARVRFAREGTESFGLEYLIGVERATLALESFKGPVFELRLQGIRIWPADPLRPDDRIVGRSMRFVLPMNPLRPREAAVEAGRVFRGLGDLVRSGSTSVPFGFDGRCVFRLSKAVQLEGRLSSYSENGRYFLAIDRTDMKRISSSLREPLTDAEIEFVRRHPLQAPELLRIRDRAVTASETAVRTDPAFPKDAYRHVLWSWLLVRAFDPEFSERATAAHEDGAPGSAEDSRMDLANNAAGRALAAEGVAEKDLIAHVLSDPRVVPG